MSPTGVRVNLSAHAKLSLSSESDPLKCELEKKVSYLKSAQLDIGSQGPSSYSTTTTITINNNKLRGENYPSPSPAPPEKGFPFNLFDWNRSGSKAEFLSGGESKAKAKSRFNPSPNNCGSYGHGSSSSTIKNGNFPFASKTSGTTATLDSISSALNNLINGFWKWSRKFAPYWEFLIFPSEFHYVARVIIMTAVTVIVLHRTALSINYRQILETYQLDEGAPPGALGLNRTFY